MTKHRAPLRHSPSERNIRKTLHHARCSKESLEHVDRLIIEILDEVRYLRGRSLRILNRLESEARRKSR